MRQLKIHRSITNRESTSLEKYLQEIGKIDILTPEEEAELTKKIKEGDQQALEKMTKANLRFVVSVAKYYQNQGLPLSDLINEGNIGLIEAAKRFDETRGFKFISYAVWWIRQSILKAMAEQSRIVKLPLNKIGDINKINKIIGQLEQEYERDPTTEEIAETLGINSSDVESTKSLSSRNSSLDQNIIEGDGDNNKTFLDIMEDGSTNLIENFIDNDHILYKLNAYLDKIPKAEADILRMFYGIGGDAKSLDDISEKIGKTVERVRQLKYKGISRLNYLINKDSLGKSILLSILSK